MHNEHSGIVFNTHQTFGSRLEEKFLLMQLLLESLELTNLKLQIKD